VTRLLAASFVTIAANCAVAPPSTVAVAWESETLIAGVPVFAEPSPLLPVLPLPAVHPEVSAARRTAKSISATDVQFLHVMVYPSFQTVGTDVKKAL
jgi:hypothetical protein